MYFPTTLRLLRDYKKGLLDQIEVIIKHETGPRSMKEDSDFRVAKKKLADLNREIEYIEAL